jgi:hypothetical protein
MSGVQTQSLVPPPADAAAIEFVQGLQRDGRLLLRFSARRPDHPLGTILPLAGADVVSAYGILTADPAGVVAGPVKFATLVACVDDLSRKAAPATVSSIRLSSAYLKIPLEDNEPPPPVAARATRLRAIMNWLIGIASLATMIVVLLLAHVDDGRRAIQQLQETRAELVQVQESFTQLPPAAWVLFTPGSTPVITSATPDTAGSPPLPLRVFIPFCRVEPDGKMEAGLQPAGGSADGARAAVLCNKRDQAALRLEMIFLRITAWNDRTHAIFLFSFSDWLCRRFHGRAACTVPPRSDTKMVEDWKRTEIRAGGAISILTGFVLPLLLGCVGGCAYVLRRLDQKLSDWTLQFHDGSHALLRVLLATMLGGLLGVIWAGNETVHLQGFTLSLAAAAFFVGFSLEVVFTVIEAMVEGVAGKLKTQAAAPQINSQVTTRAPAAAPP